MANLIDQYFPKKVNHEDRIADDILLVCKYFSISLYDLLEYDIPIFLIMRNYAITQINEETKRMNQMFKAGSGRGMR